SRERGSPMHRTIGAQLLCPQRITDMKIASYGSSTTIEYQVTPVRFGYDPGRWRAAHRLDCPVCGEKLRFKAYNVRAAGLIARAKTLSLIALLLAVIVFGYLWAAPSDNPPLKFGVGLFAVCSVVGIVKLLKPLARGND